MIISRLPGLVAQAMGKEPFKDISDESGNTMANKRSYIICSTALKMIPGNASFVTFSIPKHSVFSIFGCHTFPCFVVFNRTLMTVKNEINL